MDRLRNEKLRPVTARNRPHPARDHCSSSPGWVSLALLQSSMQSGTAL